MGFGRKRLTRLSPMYSSSTPDLTITAPPVPRTLMVEDGIPVMPTNNATLRSVSEQGPPRASPVIRASRSVVNLLGDSPPESRPASSQASAATSPGLNGMPSAPQHMNSLPVPGRTTSGKIQRKSWFSSKTTTPKEKEPLLPSPIAWTMDTSGLRNKYDLTPLLNGEHVPELWMADGDAVIYCFSKTSKKGASFCINSTMLAESQTLVDLMTRRAIVGPSATQSTADLQEMFRRQTIHEREVRSMSMYMGAGYGPRFTSTDEDGGDVRSTLYLPVPLSSDARANATSDDLTDHDIDLLIGMRNLFAFLAGLPLVASKLRHNPYHVFMQVGELLAMFGFDAQDGVTFGELVASRFEACVEQFRLDDVRFDPDKCAESIVIAEKMRYIPLYHEAFSHGIGQYAAVCHSHAFRWMSTNTQERLERAAINVQQRRETVRGKLQEFDFPEIFSGIMNSRTAEERKAAKFDEWRNSFNEMRKFTLSYLRHKYGAWPPKANSKKHNLRTGGLNRIVLKDLYRDMCGLYDLLADPTALTTRSDAQILEELETPDNIHALFWYALRKVLGEFDRSTPPVKPPIPFDIPRTPELSLLKNPTGKAKTHSDKLRKAEVTEVLKTAENEGVVSTPFIEAFRTFEIKQASGHSVARIRQQRAGHWIFMYAVLQTLPLVVIDVPALKYTTGVEHFLCEGPRAGVPWARAWEDNGPDWWRARLKAQTQLPLDDAAYGPGILDLYWRSHAFLRSREWSQSSVVMSAAANEIMNPTPLPLPAPPGGFDFGVDHDSLESEGSRSASPDFVESGMCTPDSYNTSGTGLPLPSSGLRTVSRNSIGSDLLDMMPAERGSVMIRGRRPRSSAVPVNKDITFDSFLTEKEVQGNDGDKEKKQEKKRLW